MKKSLLLLGALLAFASQAGELNQVAIDRSRISFVSKQMNVPVNGGFRKFDAQISFDPAKPDAGKAQITVDLASIDAGSAEADTEVKGKGWLNIAAFPKATFVSNSVKALGSDRFEAHGALSVKGVSRDTVIRFSSRNEGAGTWLEGGFILPRLQFKIGEGMWSDTSTVADEVQVKFKLFLTPRK